MKARDIRAALQESHDPKVINVLCTLAESLTAQQQEIMALAEMIDKLTELTLQLGTTIEGATNAVDEMKKIRGE
jgi:hypothetical protein